MAKTIIAHPAQESTEKEKAVVAPAVVGGSRCACLSRCTRSTSPLVMASGPLSVTAGLALKPQG